MHIEQVQLHDVGPFDDVTIEFPKGSKPELADVYLLTGPNGTGKSTVLYAIASELDGDQTLLEPRKRSSQAWVELRPEPEFRYVRQLLSHREDPRTEFDLEAAHSTMHSRSCRPQTQGNLRTGLRTRTSGA
jgi:ATPase subunit of ABC transporter with duplicated ATPase domains